MTYKQIKQNAEAYAEEHAVRIDGGGWEEEYDYKEQEAAYIAGAHSRDEEVKEWIESKGKLRRKLMHRIYELRHPWISVEDRLPKNREWIFFRREDSKKYYGWFDEKLKLFLTTDPDHTTWTINGVTHWMPIPEV